MSRGSRAGFELRNGCEEGRGRPGGTVMLQVSRKTMSRQSPLPVEILQVVIFFSSQVSGEKRSQINGNG
jgi:hypothetical protein